MSIRQPVADALHHAQAIGRRRRRLVRVVFLAVVLVSAAGFGVLVTSASNSTGQSLAPETAEPRENTTVVTSQNPVGKLVAYAPDGSKQYVNRTYDTYFDVDPHPSEKWSVVYTATNKSSVNRSVCVDPCARSVVEVVNFTTGEVRRLTSRYNHRQTSSEWHDVDRVAPGEYLVADMADNAVYRLDTETETIEWIWRAKDYYHPATGGPYPGDWTHLNDVEKLPDGRVMVSMRNHDQVLFLDPESGTVVEEDTLGSDGAHEIMYEQHNPDYIPESNGGPAVVIADSQNQRIVEYQRVGDDWERSWLWRDQQLSWPRDADRLPNGNTLVVDSHGNRIVEVGTEGDAVWTLPVRSPYDVERLETGDESAGGPSAVRADLVSSGRSVTTEGGNSAQSPQVGLWLTVRSALPTKLVNGLLFVIPPWIGLNEMILLLTAVGTAGLWTVVELWLSGLTVRWPVVRRDYSK